MRAQFFRPGAPDEVVGTATWKGGSIHVEAKDPETRLALSRIVRPSAVMIDDPALLPAGTTGPVLFPPGSLAWFQAAARTRAEAEGLAVRFAPDAPDAMGWDPAGAYRTFNEAVERRERAVWEGAGPANASA